MLSLLEPHAGTVSDGDAGIGESEVPTFHFQYNHPSMGVLTIRRATSADVPALPESLWRTYNVCDRGAAENNSPEYVLGELLANGIVLLVTREEDGIEKSVATVSVYNINVVNDLRYAVKHAADGDARLRIDRFPAFDSITTFGGGPFYICKETVRKILTRTTRRTGTILVARNIIVEPGYDEEAIMKFIVRKIVKILKYLYGCSHLLCETVEKKAGANEESSGKLRQVFKAVEIGYREIVPQAAGGSTDDSVSSSERAIVWISSCERLLGGAPRTNGGSFSSNPFAMRGKRKIIYAQPLTRQ